MPEVHLQERREEPDLNQIVALLLTLDQKVTDHIADEKIWKPDLLNVIELFKQAKGAITFIKWMAALGAAAAAVYTFWSTHITWKP